MAVLTTPLLLPSVIMSIGWSWYENEVAERVDSDYSLEELESWKLGCQRYLPNV